MASADSPPGTMPPAEAAPSKEAGIRRDSYGNIVGADWGVDDGEGGGDARGVDGKNGDRAASISKDDVPPLTDEGDGTKGEEAIEPKGRVNGGGGQEAPPSKNIPRNTPAPASANKDNRVDKPSEGGLPPSIQTVTITADDVASKEVSVVDPWVPRLKNNDEYLRRGLDFSPRLSRGASNNMSGDEKEVSLRGSVEGKEGEGSDEGAGESDNDGVAKHIQETVPLVGDVGAVRLAEALRRNTHLLSLNLSRSDIGPEGGVALARCLYSANVTDGQPDGYGSKTALRVLKLSHNHIGDEGALEFGMTLRHNTSLQELRLPDNDIGIEGIVHLLEGLEHNTTVKRLGLVDNAQQLNSEELTRLVERLARVCKKGQVVGESVLEVLEMHDASNGSAGISSDRDNFHALPKSDVRALRVAMRNNTRLRTLTLPSGASTDEHSKDHEREAHALRRVFGFNSFYRPILQLHDILSSPLALAQSSLNLSVKLPSNLERDERTGALIGLLPSSSKSTRSSSSRGVNYRLLPWVLGFACNESSLDAVWNVVRYRPDAFCCAGRDATVECAPCGFLGGERGCCIS